ncbi:neutral/alkaline non-lysosomal ceramidase N-terminal domain-containing protein [Bacteroidota bacterium]
MMKLTTLITTLIFIFFTENFLFAQEKVFYAGASKVNISPPAGIRLYGGYNRKDPSQSLHDSLFARSIIFEVDDIRIGIIACDLVIYQNPAISIIAKEKLNIDHVLINCSHTHSGPYFGYRDESLPEDHSEEYASRVQQLIIESLETAIENKFPARLAYGYKSFAALGYNRLVNKIHGIAMWRDDERIPYGPVDNETSVIKVEDMEGNPRIVLMQYACHPVTNHVNYDVSADYPGVACNQVEEFYQENNLICLFIQGAAGEVEPLMMSPSRKSASDAVQTDYSFIERNGTLLAEQVIPLISELVPGARTDASISFTQDTLHFTKRFNPDSKIDLEQSTVLINNEIAIAAVPGEPFLWGQFYWKENATVAVPFAFFMGYTYNGGGTYPGYLPDIRNAIRGGYGCDDSYIIEVGAYETVMNSHLENLYRMQKTLGLAIK